MQASGAGRLNVISRHISAAADEHEQIIDAVRRRNGPAARRAMEAHILEFRMKVLEELEAIPVTPSLEVP